MVIAQQTRGMRVGFRTGSITQIGSGRTEAIPLARALSKLDCSTFGLETTRFRSSRSTVEGLEVRLEPVAPYLAPRSLQIVRELVQRRSNQRGEAYKDGLRSHDLATGEAVLSLVNRLDLDVLYAFHNVNVAPVLMGWPNPSRILAINLIGFGIDPSRGGAADTFPIQKTIFDHPYWDLQIAATEFEYAQYHQIYDQLGICTKRLMHLPHSYDQEVFRPVPASHAGSSQSPRQGTRTILYPVNVYPRKNIELAIEMLAALNREIDCRLVVTGSIWDRGYQSRLLRLTGELGVSDRVEFLGGVPIEVLVALYSQADVTVYTSHQETFGHGLVESLGCGTPVVGPEWIIPCSEILSEALGGRAAPKDPRGLAAAVLETLRTTHDPARVAAAARDRYGNIAVAARFLDRCREIKAEKDGYRAELKSVDWKGLYRDDGNLL